MNDALAARIDDALPQTQCRRCGYPNCRAYARAIAGGEADIDRCPPGGAEGVARLASITGRATRPVNSSYGVEAPRCVAWIVEAHCIGCTLCVTACPVDCIVGAPKRMHTVIESECTGCELCLPVCPVDCIALEVVTPDRSGWQAWSVGQASESRQRFEAREKRRGRPAPRCSEPNSARLDDVLAESASVATPGPAVHERKRKLVQTALMRARERLGKAGSGGTVEPEP